MYLDLKEKYKRQATAYAYADMLLTDISTMFEYDVPETIDDRFIELYLLMFGECAIWEKDGALIVSYCCRAGAPNVNGLGRDLIVTTGNGTSKTFREFEKSDEVVYIRNNKYATPDLNYERTASLLTELNTSLEHNIINARYTPLIVAHDSNAKKAIETALKENNSGGVQVVLSDNIFDVAKEQVLNVTDVNAQDKIQYINHAYDDIFRQFWTLYGLTISGTSKQAQMSVEEVQDGKGISMLLPYDRLKERREGMQRLSTKFGVEASVKFSEPWEREFAKPVQAELATSQENNTETESEVEDNGNA